jgi:transcriptional regulator with XRE-family HTH domain
MPIRGEKQGSVMIDWVQAGRMVRLRRREQRLSQARLAAAMGLSARALGELERGEIVRPSAKLAEAVRALLGTLPELPARGLTPREVDIRRAQGIIAALGERRDAILWRAVLQVLALPAADRRRQRPRSITQAQQQVALWGRQADPMLWARVMEGLIALERDLR